MSIIYGTLAQCYNYIPPSPQVYHVIALTCMTFKLVPVNSQVQAPSN